jgi:glutathione synthase/RimK-type ligase-like ATP-grasp enzyme
MKIAIHNRKGSFSERWIDYCKLNSVDYKIVDCYSSEIISDLDDCDALMWHWSHNDFKAILFAKQLLTSLEAGGKKVFPNSSTGWHFDDKVGQKYLLESIKVPFVKTYTFYDKSEALKWVSEAQFPKVFKLRNGAASQNVQLVKSKKEAKKLVVKAFGQGFSPISKTAILSDRIRLFQQNQSVKSLKDVMKGIARFLIDNPLQKIRGHEKGYVYFQDFLPENHFDIRVIAMGDKALAAKRYNRPNDFRASGSGNMDFNPDVIDKRCIQIAFEVLKKIGAQTLSFDFVFDSQNNPVIVEISYGFPVKACDDAPGYTDVNLNWHPGKINPQHIILENFLNSLG